MKIKDIISILKIRWILRNKSKKDKIKIITHAFLELEIEKEIKDVLRGISE